MRASAGRGFRNPGLRELWFDMPINAPGAPLPVSVQGNRVSGTLPSAFFDGDLPQLRKLPLDGHE